MRVVSYLPREISFLADYGVSAARLANAAEAARRQGVTADRVLIAEGLLSEDDFYRALARHLGLRFTLADVAIAVSAGESYPQMIAAGTARFATRRGPASLVAPRGAAIGRLIQIASRRAASGDIVLTTPAHLSARVRHAARHDIARAASHGLQTFDADLCARGGLSVVQGVAISILGCLTALVLPAAPVACATGAAALLGLALLATFWLRLSACVASPEAEPRRSRALGDDELPPYSVVIALRDEVRVVPQILRAVEALAYPRSKLDVKLVLEADDPDTRAGLQRHNVPPNCEVLVAPPGMPGTKPRALNVALPLLRGELVAVYDAEDIPDPQQLRLAAARFAAAPARLACLQARLAIDTIGDGWPAALFAIEYAALFDVINPGLSALGLPFSLGGTSNHFRTDALRQVGGWDAWNVTEDADIGFRLARFGYATETLSSTTWEEAPVSVAALLRQRRRWCKGWYQTLIVLWRQPHRLVRDMGLSGSCVLTLIVFGNVLGPLSAPLCGLCLCADLWLGWKVLPSNVWQAALAALWTTVLLAGSASGLWPMLKGMKRRRLMPLWPALFFLPAYSLVICAAAWVALRDLILHPYHWLKTDHGRARRGPRGADVRGG